MDDSKNIGALVNGLIRQQFFADQDITIEFLKNEIFPSMDSQEFTLLHNKYKGILKSMASTNMDLAQAEIFLNSQSKKKDSGITQNHVKAILKSWKNQKDKIHECLVSKCMWDNQLKHLSWRVDVQTRSRHNEQINTPTAIVEMTIGNRNQADNQDELVRFEMNEQSASKLLNSIKEIEEQLQKHSNVNTS